jgi:hypothetical protein
MASKYGNVCNVVRMEVFHLAQTPDGLGWITAGHEHEYAIGAAVPALVVKLHPNLDNVEAAERLRILAQDLENEARAPTRPNLGILSGPDLSKLQRDVNAEVQRRRNGQRPQPVPGRVNGEAIGVGDGGLSVVQRDGKKYDAAAIDSAMKSLIGQGKPATLSAAVDLLAGEIPF